MAGDITRLKTSWTKFDAVQVINIIGNNELANYLSGQEGIDHPILKSYLGIKELTDPVPKYWYEVIKNYPHLRKMFTLLAGLYTHHSNIEDFANQYSSFNMGGVFKMGEGGKHQTNMRSALVEGGASLTSYRRKVNVPYEFTKIFEQENIGVLFKDLLKERLIRCGFSKEEITEEFFEIAFQNNFHKTISLNKQQFKNWLEGKSISQLKAFNYDLNDLKKTYHETNCIQVSQWLTSWDEVNFDLPMRKKPQGHFYMFKMDIRVLKRISDVHRRKAKKPRAEEINIQRSLKEERSHEIRNYVESGFPLSTLNDKDRLDPENQKLKMPGMLPTAILVNILGKNQKRGNSIINDADLITIKNEAGITKLVLPENVFSDTWMPELKPIEIIDGQHRLWAFDESEKINGDFEVPVVAYYDLDRAWQAYLFYMINIKPKKINTSLGYDLYPLLRTQEWLENSKEGLKVYRETRAQELVEALWLFEESPWHKRISMLGEESSYISQNAFIRALSDSYFRKVRRDISGLFGDVLKKRNFEELKWVRAQQAGFLILLWDEIAKALNTDNTKDGEIEWVDMLRKENVQMTLFEKELRLDKSFISKNSNLSRDQGVTGISMFSNDFFYVLANESEIDLNEIDWDSEIDERQIDSGSIDLAINKFVSHPVYTYVQLFAREVIKLDWRTSSAEFEDENKREFQKKYRGSGGYREIWNDLLKIFLSSKNEKVKHYSSILAQMK